MFIMMIYSINTQINLQDARYKAAWLTRLLSDATVFVFKYEHYSGAFKVCVLVTVNHTGFAFPKSFQFALKTFLTDEEKQFFRELKKITSTDDILTLKQVQPSPCSWGECILFY